VKFLALMLPVVLFYGCGSSSNINQIWGADDEGSDSMLAEAVAAYDSKDYQRAENLTVKLLARNPDNEAAAIMLGYTMLSKGGIEPIALARKLIQLSGKPDEGTPETGTTETDPSQASGDATSTLGQLGSLINLSDADFGNLAEKTFDQESNDGTPPALFATDNSLIIPAKVSAELRAKVPVLDYMNSALRAVCRFVDDSTKNVDDSRHADPSCTQTSVQRKSKAKAHFLWAFSHLTEALVYQSVVLYSGVGTGGTSNFQKASDKINTENYGTDIGRFVDNVREMKNAVDLVFDTSSPDSMITATLLNLDTVNKGFAAIAGLPPGITEKISKSLQQLNKVSESLGSTGVEGNTQALKGQMTETFAKVIGGKIEKVATENELIQGKTYQQLETQLPDSPEKTQVLGQLGSMCKGYDSLAKGLPPEKDKKPATCNGAPTN